MCTDKTKDRKEQQNDIFSWNNLDVSHESN